jgi:hypothetical protein
MNQDEDVAADNATSQNSRNIYDSDEIKYNMTTYSRSETTFGLMLDSTEHPCLSAVGIVDGDGQINLNETMRSALPTACFVLRHESPHSIETITSLLWEIAVSMSKEMHEYIVVAENNESSTGTTTMQKQTTTTMMKAWIPQVFRIMSKLTEIMMKNDQMKKSKTTVDNSIRRLKKDVNHRVYLELACRFRILSSEFSDVCETERVHRERCSIVQRGLIDLLSEVDPIKLLTKLKSAQVCRVCKTARYLIPRQDSVRSADEGARTFLDCYNPIHGGEIVVQNDG